MKRLLPLILVIIISGCDRLGQIGAPKTFFEKIQPYYNEIKKEYKIPENGTLSESEWKFSYHPILLAAYGYYASGQNPEGLESKIDEAVQIYQEIWSEVIRQVESNLDRFNSDLLLAPVDDDEIRNSALEIMDGDVLAHYAFTRAWVNKNLKPNYGPEIVMGCLGRIYMEHPELLESGFAEETEFSKKRDFLEASLAAYGSDAVKLIITIDDELFRLQDNVPNADFWVGSVTHTFNLRAMQLVRAETIQPVMDYLTKSTETAGTGVRPFENIGLAKWMYWNFIWTLNSQGGMFPYTEADKEKVDEFIDERLRSGGTKENEEAWIIADAIGRAPSFREANRLFDFLTEASECEKKKISYMGLSRIFDTPLPEWLESTDQIFRMKTRAISVMNSQALDCGNIELLDFYLNAIDCFAYQLDGVPDSPGFSNAETMLAHEYFFEILDKLEKTDERFHALQILNFEFLPPPFMMNHPELGKFRENQLQLHKKWSETTDFSSGNVNENDFKTLLNGLQVILGGESKWKN